MPRQRKRSASKKTAAKKTVARKMPTNVTSFISETNDVCGAGTARLANENPLACHIPTGCFIMDMAMVGGFVEGHAAMLYGYESSGKTTVCLCGVAQYMAKHPDKYVLWVDSERMLDKLWAEQLGVDIERLVHVEPETGEMAVDIIDNALQRPEFGLVVLDSLPALVPFKEAEASALDVHVALRARLVGKMCSSITVRWAQQRREGNWTAVWVINQWRFKIGVMFGDPRTLPGGRQIQHLPATKLELKIKKEIVGSDSSDNPVHDYNEHAFKLAKHKVAPSIPSGDYEMSFNPNGSLTPGSFMDMPTVITYAKRMGYIGGGGASWRCHTIIEDEGRDIKFRGAPAIKEHLLANPEQYLSLRKTLVAHQRRNVKLDTLPPDGYLLSHAGNIHLLPQA